MMRPLWRRILSWHGETPAPGRTGSSSSMTRIACDRCSRLHHHITHTYSCTPFVPATQLVTTSFVTAPATGSTLTAVLTAPATGSIVFTAPAVGSTLTAVLTAPATGIYCACPPSSVQLFDLSCLHHLQCIKLAVLTTSSPTASVPQPQRLYVTGRPHLWENFQLKMQRFSLMTGCHH